jgi:hypothetical protein
LLHVERVDAVLHAHGLTASHLATVGGAALLPGRIAFLARRADGN